MKPLIISFASKGREDYLKMSETMYISVKEHWKYDYLFYTMDGNRDEFQGMKLTQITELPQPSTWHCNTHKEVPYQFKFGLIDHAREMGYDKIIWIDSSISLNKCPLKLLEQTNKGIMCFHNLGHETADYISDEAFNMVADYQRDLIAPQIWGGCIGFDFTRSGVKEIFDRIIHYSCSGAFNEGTSNRSRFKAHRHDQSVMSVLFYKEGVLPYNYGHIVTTEHNKEPFEYGNYFTFIYGKN